MGGRIQERAPTSSIEDTEQDERRKERENAISKAGVDMLPGPFEAP